MSFFGFNTAGPGSAATGTTHAHNPFAGLSNRDDEGDALEFEDTYDGLGDQLDETDDAFNDETFGGDSGGFTASKVGNDFDFFGQTAGVATAIEEEHVRFNRVQPVARATQPTTTSAPQGFTQSYAQTSYGFASQPPAPAPKKIVTGYEQYKSEPVGELQIDASLWGDALKKPSHQAPAAPSPAAPSTSIAAPPGKKIMSLEEVEAQMRAQAKKPSQPVPSLPVSAPSPAPAPSLMPQMQYDTPQFPQHSQAPIAPQGNHALQQNAPFPAGQSNFAPVAILQRPQSKHAPSPQPAVQQPPQQPLQQPAQHPLQQHRQQPPPAVQPTQILQNPNRLSGDGSRPGIHSHGTPPVHGYPTHPGGHRPQGSFSRQPHGVAHPAQLSQLSEEEKAAFLEQEAKRAKRNHKIFLMSRDNGIMTPQDKNFVTRIQLQQLVAATGNPNEHGTDESMAEDFYYQVHNQIQGGHRQHPGQPLNNFAQTYLFQTGGRQPGMRRHHRGPENHMQRMEQQVQRAVEAAKNKPKNKQLVIEGSLGKISFSNAKTPKPLLNIKRNETASEIHRPGSAHRNGPSVNNIKNDLRRLERIYSIILKLEDHDRSMPPPPASEADTEGMQKTMAWHREVQTLNEELWSTLRVHDHPENGSIHPFIALLSYAKGNRVMQRIFRHLSHEQRTIILTLIVVNLDNLDVVRNGQVTVGLNATMREKVEFFSANVMSILFNFLNELDLEIVAGVLGIVGTRNVDMIAKSKIGAAMLTMILSRAEIIRHNRGGSEQAWVAWDATYTKFFDMIEPSLPYMFPGPVTAGDDVYVWQLLAALGIGAGPDQQQRLVLAVKDRVMDTVALSKTLPPDLAAQRLQNVNLFMRSIGLDVELLQ